MLTAEQIAAARADLRRGTTLPYAWYADEAVLTAERAGIFARSWHYVGLVDQVERPGSVLRADLAGLPVVLVRGRDGVLRGFHNVCRHRGAVLVREDCGVRNTLQCHYHAWTYDLDGSLRAAPRADRESEFDKTARGLVQVAVDTWGPFGFVYPWPDAPALADWLGELPALVADAGIDVHGLRLHHRVRYSLSCNWKIAVENFLECYHCAVAHPAFADVMDTGPDAYNLQVRPSFAWQRGPTRPQQRGGDPTAGEIDAGQYFMIWPSIKININPGRPNMSIGPVYPSGPHRTEAFLDYLFGPDVPTDWIDAMIAFDDQVGTEDRELIESVHRGVSGGGLACGRFMVDSELQLQAFGAWVAERLADHISAGPTPPRPPSLANERRDEDGHVQLSPGGD
jgi:phenylpropionate dioxygenase-like ring-hydroxylating dioxygenase large terminal subunit